MPPEVSNYVVESYVRLRKLSKDEEVQNKSHTYTSARTLLGVLRLAQALARLRFSDRVDHADVDEALRLMEVSKESLQDDEDRERDQDRSIVSQIYRLIKDMAAKQGGGRRKSQRQKRMGKGPGGERDMDVDEDMDSDEDEEALSLVDIRARVLRKGFTEDQLMDTILQVCLHCFQVFPRSPLPSVRGNRCLDPCGQQYEASLHRYRQLVTSCAFLCWALFIYSCLLRCIAFDLYCSS